MKGCPISEFIDALLEMGGPEIEFIDNTTGISYLIRAKQDSRDDIVVLELGSWKEDDPRYKGKIWKFKGKDLAECVTKFEKAKAFSGKTIYEADKNLEHLYG